MKRLLIIIVIIAVLAAIPLLLQDRVSGQGQLILVNQAGVSLDTERIETAAQTLTGERAVDIAIYIVDSGSESDFHQRLRNDGLVNSASQLQSRAFAIYIGIDNRYSEIGWGATLSVVNGSQIRHEILNPRLQEGDYTGAILNALNITTERFANPYSIVTSLFADMIDFIKINPMVGIVSAFIGFFVLRDFVGWLFGAKSKTGSNNSDDHHLHHDTHDSGSIDFGSSDSGGFDGGSWDD